MSTAFWVCESLSPSPKGGPEKGDPTKTIHNKCLSHLNLQCTHFVTPVHPIFSLSPAKLYVKPAQGIMCGLCADIHTAKMSRGHAAKMSSPKMSALYVLFRIPLFGSPLWGTVSLRRSVKNRRSCP